MTCIVGAVEGDTVYIGADSAAVGGSLVRALKRPKVFRNGPFIIGYTSSFRMGQLLEYALEVPGQEEDMPDEEYMVTVFVGAVRECLNEHGFLKIDSGREEIGAFLVGYRDGLYCMAEDLQILQTLDGIAACGSAHQFALAVMYDRRGLAARFRIGRALEAAAYFSTDVVRPFGVRTTRGAENEYHRNQ